MALMMLQMVHQAHLHQLRQLERSNPFMHSRARALLLAGPALPSRLPRPPSTARSEPALRIAPADAPLPPLRGPPSSAAPAPPDLAPPPPSLPAASPGASGGDDARRGGLPSGVGAFIASLPWGHAGTAAAADPARAGWTCWGWACWGACCCWNRSL